MDASLIPNERQSSKEVTIESRPIPDARETPNECLVSSQTKDIGNASSQSRSDSPTQCSFLGRYKLPSWCNQVFTRPVSLLIFMCFIHFFQSSLVVGYMNAILSTLERQLGLHSKVMGLILSSFELSSMIV